MPQHGIVSQSAAQDSGLRVEVLPLASREWKNGSNSSYNCTPFLQSLPAKGKKCDVLSVMCWAIFAARTLISKNRCCCLYPEPLALQSQSRNAELNP